MPVRFGVFVPQGWRMDLTEIEDPIEQYEAMTRVGKVADETGAYDSIWVYDHFHTVQKGGRGVVVQAFLLALIHPRSAWKGYSRKAGA